MQRQLLAQHLLARFDRFTAEQLRHHRLCRDIAVADFHHRRFYGWLEIETDDIQQNVVARHFKAFAEELFRCNAHVNAFTVIQRIAGDHQIGGATANVDGGDLQAALFPLRLLIIGATGGGKKNSSVRPPKLVCVSL